MARYDEAIVDRFSAIEGTGSRRLLLEMRAVATTLRSMHMTNHAAVDFRRREFLSLAGVATLCGALSWRTFAQAPAQLLANCLWEFERSEMPPVLWRKPIAVQV